MGSSGSKPGSLVAPLLLRVALGITFVWAGLGKLVPIVDYKGQDAAILANLGTGIVPLQPLKPPTSGVQPPALAPPATLPLPEATPADKPATPPPTKPSSRQQKRPPDIGYSSAGSTLALLATDDLSVKSSTRGNTRPASANGKAQPPAPATGQPPAATPTPPAATLRPTPAADTLPPGGKYKAADFAEPARARRAYGLSVMMVKAAYPQPSVGVPNPKAYWPAMFASSPWVVWLAFGAAVTELFAGVLLLVGFLTRLSAMMLVAVMATAMWLTQIGPALSIGQTSFGFLPDKTWWDPQLWTAFFWQLLIMASGIAIACSGAGAFSVDRALALIGSGGPKSEQDPSAKG